MSKWMKKNGYESEEDFFRILRLIPKPLRIFWSKRRLERFYRWEKQQKIRKERDRFQKTKKKIKKSKNSVSFSPNPKTKEQHKKNLEQIRKLQNQQSKQREKSCEQDLEM